MKTYKFSVKKPKDGTWILLSTVSGNYNLYVNSPIYIPINPTIINGIQYQFDIPFVVVRFIPSYPLNNVKIIFPPHI